MTRSRDPEALTRALEAGYAGVALSPDAARRMRTEILDSSGGAAVSRVRQWLVGAAVTLAALLAPIAAASQAVL